MALRKTVKEWSKRTTPSFKLTAKDAPAPPPSPSPAAVPKRHTSSFSPDSIARKHSRSESRNGTDEHRERRVSRSSARRSASPESARRQSSTSSVHPTRSPEAPLVRLRPNPINPIMEYVDCRSLQDVAWTSGYYARQNALLSAIDMKANLAALAGLPVFSPEEIMILSFRPNSAALPYLEGPPNSRFRYASEDRLALERIYRDKGFLAIEQTKWLMETRAIRPLADYADMMAKIKKTFAVATSSKRRGKRFTASSRSGARTPRPATQSSVSRLSRPSSPLARVHGWRSSPTPAGFPLR